ncbi:nuclear transport factor 2 family protein [Mycolicibacterium palauense]|uniref:nuclear transport factor 2 family protein n=1 Tax=Mycolicibacterium palauense TaxID=2034511 RepID=UPI000BFEAD5D|nr:nuclear transport factor 2 family protein [Mycolicibacterium palauense]
MTAHSAPSDPGLSELLDRERIRDCLARLARGEDRRDAALIAGAYWPDATVDHGIFTGSFDDYLAWVVPGSPDIPNTQHVLGQSLIEPSAGVARVETHVLAYHRVATPAGHRDSMIGGRYLDRMTKRAGQWRITHRVMVYDWFQELGDSVDWSTGLMGMPFDTRGYAGSATADPSEQFLGGGGAPGTTDDTH